MHWLALQAPPECTTTPNWQVGGTDEFAPWADALTALGWWALQWTPKVACVDRTLLLELSASERLWGGRALVLRRILESNKPLEPVNYAQGATSLIAMALLQSGSSQGPGVNPDTLPLAALAAAQPHLATLEKIGCTRWGQLRALPRGGVARRFGALLLQALDQAYGQGPDLYPWLVLPEVFQARLELPHQVETAPALLFGARRLFKQLQLWLQLRQIGVLAVRLMWVMDARRETAGRGELVLRSAEPATDMTHLQGLLGEHLARLTLAAPVLSLSLRTLETKELRRQSMSLVDDEQVNGESWKQMVERLTARLGPAQVLQMRPCAEHLPERMQTWEPALNAIQLVAGYAVKTGYAGHKSLKAEALYPTWLLATPLKLVVHGGQPQYHGTVYLLAGPQRLEVPGWSGHGSALRDYFLGRSEQAGLLWLYRERLGVDHARWYLHGLFG